jgi:predicted nucleic acid-binding protein
MPCRLRAALLGLDEEAADAWVRRIRSERVRDRFRSGRAVGVSTLAWGEFLCGPVDARVEVLAHEVVRAHAPLGSKEAAEGAGLFHATGRMRGSFQDCLIAATAIVAKASLATTDRADFSRFESLGLQLEP